MEITSNHKALIISSLPVNALVWHIHCYKVWFMVLFMAQPRQTLHRGNTLLAVCLALFACFPASCLAEPAPALSLADAKAAAFQHNWDLLAAKSGINSAEAQLIVAKEFPNPTASLSLSYIGAYNSATIEGNSFWHRSYDTLAAVSQLIEIAGKRHDRQAAGRAGIMGARARFHDAKRTLDQGVAKAYVAALLAWENARVLRDSARLLNHESEIGEARLKAGDLSDSDFKQIQINAGQFELQAGAADAAATQARIQVEILMGAPQPKGQWTPADTLEQLAAKAPAPVVTTTGALRPDVLAAQADLRGSEFNLKLQRAMRVPDPTFLIQYEHEPLPPGPPADNTFGLGLSFPLPLWNLNRGNIAAAQASLAQYQDALGKAAAQAAADVAGAQVEYDEAAARLRHYQKAILSQSAKVRESVSFAFEKGAATLVDLLEAERTDNTVRLAAAQAMADTASATADVIAAQTTVSELSLNSAK
jgi:cobalt-zinc-cadmium efflux system outer membrane protein